MKSKRESIFNAFYLAGFLGLSVNFFYCASTSQVQDRDKVSVVDEEEKKEQDIDVDQDDQTITEIEDQKDQNDQDDQSITDKTGEGDDEVVVEQEEEDLSGHHKKRHARKRSNNLVFEAFDKGETDPSKDQLVYYRIVLNREPAAKTESGLFFQIKDAELKVPPGRYHLYLERWYMYEDKNRGIMEYRRANNIWQMRSPVYLDIDGDIDEYLIMFGYDHDKKEFYFEISTVP